MGAATTLWPRCARPPRGNDVSRLTWTTDTTPPQLLAERGRATSGRVLLVLHGGPGLSITAAPAIYASLESDMVVVHWDQPGSTTACLAPGESLGLEQVVADGLAVVDTLAARHGVQQVGLLGASWGSMVGAEMVRARPELFWGYIAEGQVVSTARAEAEAMDALRRVPLSESEQRQLEALRRTPHPFARPSDVGTLRSMLVRHEMVAGAWWPYLALGLSWVVGPEHTPVEKLQTPLCLGRAAAALSSDIRAWDLAEKPWPERVPTLLLHGRHDYLTGPETIASWAAQHTRGELELVWFDDAGHVPSLESPEEVALAVGAFVEMHAPDATVGDTVP